jgi:hypothetical protein
MRMKEDQEEEEERRAKEEGKRQDGPFVCNRLVRF